MCLSLKKIFRFLYPFLVFFRPILNPLSSRCIPFFSFFFSLLILKIKWEKKKSEFSTKNNCGPKVNSNYVEYKLKLISQPRPSICFYLFLYIFSRLGWSKGLLYKQPRNSLIDSFSNPFPTTALWCPHAQTDSISSYKIDYFIYE